MTDLEENDECDIGITNLSSTQRRKGGRKGGGLGSSTRSPLVGSDGEYGGRYAPTIDASGGGGEGEDVEMAHIPSHSEGAAEEFETVHDYGDDTFQIDNQSQSLI